MKKYLDDPRITAYALGELQGPEAEEIKRLVEQNEELKAQVAHIQVTAGSLSELLKKEELVPLKEELHEGLRALSSSRRFFSRTWMLMGSSLAVAGLALVISTRNFQTEQPKKLESVVEKEVPAKKFKTTLQKGRAVRQAEVVGESLQKDKEVSKTGLFSALGTSGMKKNMDKAYQAHNDVLGMAEKSPGDVGTGGKGTATQGIAGVGTKGRGTGYGGEDKLGDTNSFEIKPGGEEEEFVGTVDREAVRRVIRAGTREIRGCYERELKKLDKARVLQGKVVIEWTIADRGRALNAKVKSSTLGNRAVENCVRDRLSTWRFPEPPAGTVVKVKYPVYFRSAK